MEIPSEIREDFLKLQQLQQTLQNLMYQKQNIQVQKIEVENAMRELKNSENQDAYEIVGTIMLKRKTEKLTASLKDRGELFDLRLKSLDKQINKQTDEAKQIQEKIAKTMNKKKEG